MPTSISHGVQAKVLPHPEVSPPEIVHSSQCIPPDIIEDIVGHLAKDIASLKACSLVSYLLRPISQKLIFSRIKLNVDTDIEKGAPSHRRKRYHSLLEIIADNPLIPRYVRILYIGLCAHMPYSNRLEREFALRDELTLPGTLQLFTNLQELHTLASCQFWRVPPMLDAALCSVVALESLETLTFNGIMDFPVKHYSQHFTSLKRLEIDDVSLRAYSVDHSFPDALGRASGKMYRLQELSLLRPITDFPLHVRELGLDISQLVHFKFTTLDIECENQVEAAWQIASATSQTLTHLVWDSWLCEHHYNFSFPCPIEELTAFYTDRLLSGSVAPPPPSSPALHQLRIV
ncbi:hypothetical protein B0H34DRAFT_799099 [Crassisporium funariophilum]|nr:hypothetical protein B0H34DRAFT_799099 [Crassisporium funariophilum]